MEVDGIKAFQTTVSQGISKELLVWKGISATEELCKSNNTKIVIIGNTKNGLPMIFSDNKN
jgi:prohibitin 1